MESDLENYDRESNLHAAIEQFDVERVRQIVGGGGDIEEVDGHGATPLVKAVQMDSLEMVDLLLGLGADVNTPVFVGSTETSMTRSSMKNDLTYAIIHAGFLFRSTPKLTPMRHQIIKRLIAAGSDLDVTQQFQHMYISPLQNACQARLWPVILDLIEAGSKVDNKGPYDAMPLTTVFSVDDEDCEDHFNDPFEDEYWYLAGYSKKRALELLVEKSPTLRLVTTGGSLFKQLIDGCSARVLCMLLWPLLLTWFNFNPSMDK